MRVGRPSTQPSTQPTPVNNEGAVAQAPKPQRDRKEAQRSRPKNRSRALQQRKCPGDESPVGVGA